MIPNTTNHIGNKVQKEHSLSSSWLSCQKKKLHVLRNRGRIPYTIIHNYDGTKLQVPPKSNSQTKNSFMLNSSSTREYVQRSAKVEN